MVDHTDIDALLIGALYGELTPADEARLTAHLESHPADRSALAGLEQARTAIRESRILEVQLDPPQAVSALLLQEAHRRAPRRADAGEGWFVRFVRSFVAHPAMAAAAMLVVVVGVAGTVYMERGASSLDTETHSVASEQTVAMTPAAGSAAPVQAAPGAPAQAEPTPPVEPPTLPQAGSAMRVGLANGTDGYAGDRARDSVAANDKNAERSDVSRKLAKSEAKPEPTPAKPRAAVEGKKKILAVETEQAMPKDLDDAEANATTGAGAPAPAEHAAAPQPKTAAPPSASPPPPPAPSTVAQNQIAAPAPADVAKQGKLFPNLAWAKQEHEQAKALVAKNDCIGAARLVLDVSNRAPDYYQQYMETDRALKGCKSYIEAAREGEAEKQNKARPSRVKATDSSK